MKNKLFKVAALSLMSFSLSACSVLSDFGIGGKSDITKMAKYSHEVTFKEFVDKLKSSIKTTTALRERLVRIIMSKKKVLLLVKLPLNIKVITMPHLCLMEKAHLRL